MLVEAHPSFLVLALTIPSCMVQRHDNCWDVVSTLHPLISRGQVANADGLVRQAENFREESKTTGREEEDRTLEWVERDRTTNSELDGDRDGRQQELLRTSTSFFHFINSYLDGALTSSSLRPHISLLLSPLLPSSRSSCRSPGHWSTLSNETLGAEKQDDEGNTLYWSNDRMRVDDLLCASFSPFVRLNVALISRPFVRVDCFCYSPIFICSFTSIPVHVRHDQSWLFRHGLLPRHPSIHLDTTSTSITR